MIIIDWYNEFQVGEDNSLITLASSSNKKTYNESSILYSNYLKDVYNKTV